jgi:hypothetical protein
MWCAIAMPPYGGFFMAVDPLQKHIFRGALYAQRLFQIPRSGGRLFYSRHSKTQCDNPLTPVQAASKQGCWPAPDSRNREPPGELGNLQLSERERRDLVAFLATLSDQPASMRLR